MRRHEFKCDTIVMADKWKHSLGLGLAYYVTGSIGLLLPMFGSSITLIWLPTGISVGILYRYGLGCWPGIAIGAFLTNFTNGSSSAIAIAIAIGNTLGPILATYLLHRLRFDRGFERPREICIISIAASIGMIVSATMGVTTLSMAGEISHAPWRAWLTWWLGDTMGVIAAAPLVMVLSRRELRLLAMKRLEFAGWFAVAILFCLVVFVWNQSETKSAEALALFPLPIIVWAATRFGAIGTSLGVIVFAVGAAIGVTREQGPFTTSSQAESAILLWMYMLVCVATGWLVRILSVSQQQTASLQKLLERAMNDASLGVLLCDSDGLTVYANQGFGRLTGYQPSEILGKSGQLLQGPKTDPTTIRELEDAMQNDLSFSGEIQNYRKDGTTYWAALNFSPIHDESGTISGFLGVHQDVTVRRATQTALTQSEERLRMMVDIEPECVSIVSRDGRLVEMNSAGLRMIGADSLDQVRGLEFHTVVAPEDRERFLAMHRDVVEQGKAENCEFSMIGLKGTRLSLEANAVPYRDDHGEIIGKLCIIRDLTERKETTEKLERTLAEMEMFINRVPALVFFVDSEERYQLVNPRVEDLFNLPADKIIGRRVRDLHTSQAYSEIEPAIRRALNGETVRNQKEIIRPNGAKFYFDAQLLPRIESDGRVSGFFSFVVDVTEHKMAELALQESELRFRTLTNLAPVGIFTTDEKGDCNFVNSRWSKLAGVSSDEAMGKGWSNVLHPADRERVEVEWQTCVNNGSEFVSKYRFVTPDGQESWIYGSASALRDERGSIKGFVGTITDFTELLEAKEVLRASLNEKDAMLKEIHHRVKNNLQIVTSLLSLQAMGDTNSETASLLQESCNRVRSMALVHETLYGTSDFGKLRLAEYLDQLCCHLFRSYGIDPLRIRLDMRIAEVSLQLDRAIPFGLIINELVSNALKYAFPLNRQGTIYLHVNSLTDGHFELLVRDDGVGLPDSFNLRKLKSLGLQLVSDLVIQLGGKLSFSGQAGSDFRMTFPVDNSE